VRLGFFLAGWCMVDFVMLGCAAFPLVGTKLAPLSPD
jgi:hypothetical protein